METLHILENKYHIELPISYKEWFSSKGYNAKHFVGTDMNFPRLSELQEWATELIEEDQSTFQLPPNAFVFAMHQGYQFMYFICDGNPDPEVWYYFEGNLEPKVMWESFSAFVQNT